MTATITMLPSCSGLMRKVPESYLGNSHNHSMRQPLQLEAFQMRRLRLGDGGIAQGHTAAKERGGAESHTHASLSQSPSFPSLQDCPTRKLGIWTESHKLF